MRVPNHPRPSRILRLLALSAVVACGSSETASVAPPATVTPPVTPSIGVAFSGPFSAPSLAQGQTATIALVATRAGGFAGAVDLSVEALPSGVTATFTPASLAASVTSATLKLSASFSATPGSFVVTVRARAVGVADVTAALPYTVTADPRNLALHFCASDYPIWVATQDDNGAWTRALPDPDNVIRAAVATRGGVAVVFGGEDLEVAYGTTSELAAQFAECAGDAPRTKLIHGQVAGLSSFQTSRILLGPSSASAVFDAPGFTLNGVPEGPLDLVTTLYSAPPANAASSFIIRRGLNLADGGALSLLDFGKQEAVAASTGIITLVGAPSSGTSLYLDFQTAGGTAASVSRAQGTGSSLAFVGIPSSLLVPGDLHQFDVEEEPTGPSVRLVYSFSQTASSRTITFGPPINAPTVAAVAGTARWQAQLPRQAGLNAYVDIIFEQDMASFYRSANIGMTAAYLGTSSPAVWSLTVPDLLPAGFNPNWGFRSDLSAPAWSVGAFGAGAFTDLVAPKDGTTITAAFMFSDAIFPAKAARAHSRVAVAARTASIPRCIAESRVGLIASTVRQRL